MNERCDWSDLIRDECGHCNGAPVTLLPPMLRVIDDSPQGRVVWPLPYVKPEPVAVRHDEATEPDAGPVVKVARDLREILRLHDELLAEAEASGDHPSIPGGAAMVALGNVANMETWENLHQASERYGRAYTSVESEDPDDAWSAYQLIEFWSESWRRERGEDYDMKRTIGTEANYVRGRLEWAAEKEPHFTEFAADINRARLRLEDIVHQGERVERTRIECNQCEPRRPDESRTLLIRLYGAAPDGSDDRWKCPSCKVRLDADGIHRAHAKMLHSEGAERWIHQGDAIGTLRAQDRPERTVRQWISEGIGTAFCDPVDHSVWVWWPELWRKHLTTATRKRGA